MDDPRPFPLSRKCGRLVNKALECISFLEKWCILRTHLLHQGVVTYTSPVEAFATGIKNLDRWKSSLIAWSLHFKALDRLILREFKGQNVATPAKYLKCVDHLILVAQNSSWSLDRLLKRTLITWFHFDPGRKRFYRRCLCDYPLYRERKISLSRVGALIRVLTHLGEDPQNCKNGPPQPKTSSYAHEMYMSNIQKVCE